MTPEGAFRLVADELARQDEKFGPHQRHSPAMWLAVLTEEVGEVCRHVRDGYYESMEGRIADDRGFREELVQVAAVAVRMLERIGKEGVEDA